MNSHCKYQAVAEQISYCPATGAFTRKSDGSPAGGRDAYGYLVLKVGAAVVKAHRFAWFVSSGSVPSGDIDHINCDKSDNRLANLRDVPRGVNVLNIWTPRKDNRGSGLQGVSKIKRCSNRWAARITRAGKRVHIGCFASPEEAHAAYLAVKSKLLQEAVDASAA